MSSFRGTFLKASSLVKASSRSVVGKAKNEYLSVLHYRMSRGGEGRGEHTRQGNSEFVSWEIPNADYANEKKKSLRVRYVYSIIFLILNHVEQEERNVFTHSEFFVTRKLHEPRNLWHSSWWSLKFIVFIVSMLAPFFFPPALIQLYGEFARAGAGIFLILQLISVIQFISWWNKYWMPDEKMKQSCSLGLFTSTIFYIASFCGIGLMYSLYVPKMRCVLNIFFISWTLILLIVMMAVSLHSKVNRGLLSSGIMASYVVFLCWSAIRSEWLLSEPATEKCSARKEESGNNDWITILSFLIAICAVVMATFSTGIDSQSFQFRKDEVKEEDDIPYKYGFFHLTFSLGAMYFAMLFISWNLNNSATKWSMDVGWTSTWVKIINEWFAATIYLWTLMSPVVRKAKVRDNEEGAVVQEANDSAIP
ncbi:putative serine incorporator isoform X2 [Cucumis melo var. makuwa]|uniref:Putative serine incorporator isoform X2 n=1 Tax=Cucumis melo var. makuwa TaxID=1194695 RepID=A0A5D3CZN9_CUCMM|nr:putative serine incorporator isoform X2 [Cucumis melo var. makuwa]